jgi:hypothetical protein
MTRMIGLIANLAPRVGLGLAGCGGPDAAPGVAAVTPAAAAAWPDRTASWP